jgi:S-adenosyl methyltransferase
LTYYRPDWAPDYVDLETPAEARMYDFYLGGSHNFAADRQLAKRAIAAYPDIRSYCVANRGFLRRSVSMLAAWGIDQFLDLGSGIPTVGNVHEVASAANPRARTVYVDSDPVAFAHGASLLADKPDAHFIQADLRDPSAVLGHSELDGFLDFDRPMAVLLYSVLPFIPDSDDPAAIVAAYRDATAPGSYLALSHGTADYKPAQVSALTEVYTEAIHTMHPRSRAAILNLMDGYDLLEPGLTDAIQWHPDQDPADPLGGDVTRYSLYAAVGRIPGGLGQCLCGI